MPRLGPGLTDPPTRSSNQGEAISAATMGAKRDLAHAQREASRTLPIGVDFCFSAESWSERGDLNSRPPVPQSANYCLSGIFPFLVVSCNPDTMWDYEGHAGKA
jgi:hypothetical protein